MNLFIDPDMPPPRLRQSIYDRDLVVFTKLHSVRKFVDYTREQLSDLFKPYEPEHAHEHIDKVEMAKLLGSWKPRFIRSSSCQLHASIPNGSWQSRFSVDFRTVDVADLDAGRAAPLVDDDCTGTAIRDFRRVADGAPFDEERCFGAPPPGATLVFAPPITEALHVS